METSGHHNGKLEMAMNLSTDAAETTKSTVKSTGASIGTSIGAPSSQANEAPSRPAVKRLVLRLMLITLATGLLLGAAAWGWRTWVHRQYDSLIVAPALAPPSHVAIIFGARVYPSGRLSPMLMDRVQTGVDLYHAGTVNKLLMSGDNSAPGYDEPGAMMAYAVAQGVAPDDVVRDDTGLRTYDTCYRAKHIFQVDEAILVTNEFHLPRALYTCSQLGIAVTGVNGDQRTYGARSLAWSEMREVPATVAALLDILAGAPAPNLGEPAPIQ